MSKKNLVVVAVFLAGLLGGATAAKALSRADDMTPCAVDMCWDAKHRCVICPDQ